MPNMTLLIACILINGFELSAWWYLGAVLVFASEFLIKDHFEGRLWLDRHRELETAIVTHLHRNRGRDISRDEDDA